MNSIPYPYDRVAFTVLAGFFCLSPCLWASGCSAEPLRRPVSSAQADTRSAATTPVPVSPILGAEAQKDLPLISYDANASLFSVEVGRLTIARSLWAAVSAREQKGLIAFAEAYQGFTGEGPPKLSPLGEFVSDSIAASAYDAVEDNDIRRRRGHRRQAGHNLSINKTSGYGSAEVRVSLPLVLDDDDFRPIRPHIPSTDRRARAQSALRAAVAAGVTETVMISMLRRAAAAGVQDTQPGSVPTQSQIDARQIIRDLGMLAF